MSADQNLFALFVAIARDRILRAIHFYLMKAWEFFFNRHFAFEFRAILSAPFLAVMTALKYLFTRFLTFKPDILLVAFDHHFVAARLHLHLYLCDAGLVISFAFVALLLAFVAAGEGADTGFHAFPVIVSCRVFLGFPLVRVADRLATMAAVETHVAFPIAATLGHKLEIVQAFHLAHITVILTLKRDEVAEIGVIFKVIDHLLPEFKFLRSN
jgi:hypothetical protein